MGLNLNGTGILAVLGRSEHVADQCIKFGRVQGCQNRALLDWHQNPGSLFEFRMCRSPDIAINFGGSKKVKSKLTRLAREY